MRLHTLKLSWVSKPMHSCIYTGTIRHRRRTPRPHAFNYKLFMMYLDLDELPALFKPYWLWSADKFNLAWFKRSDHLHGKQSLKETILDNVEFDTGQRPTGAVRLLTHLRYFGYGFNPVSFYYCFDVHAAQERLHSIVVEVNNTPWGERHIYVLPVSSNAEKKENAAHKFTRNKAFHVSPFMPMDIEYTWCLSEPDELLDVHIENRRNQEKIFDATMALKQMPISTRSLRTVLIRFPLMTIKVITTIYFEALRLWIKRTPLFDHVSTPANSKVDT